jgi:hypothetical protein
MTIIDHARFARHRDETAAMAQRYGWQVPADYTRLTAIAAAARAIEQEQPSQDGDPTKPEAVDRWCEKQATSRAHHAERVRAAGELAERCDLSATRSVLSEIPGRYIPALCAEFAKAVQTFREVTTTAPAEVTSTTSPAGAEQHVALLGCVDQLTIGAADRVTLAATTGELASLDRGNAAWLYLSPDESTATVHQVIEFLTEFRSSPVDLSGWQRALTIGVSLAQHDQATIRRDRFGEARHASGMSPSGGLQDMLIREALDLIGARPPRQLAAST